MVKTFTLIVCTYMRPQALLKLLQTVNNQTLYPDDILIIDGSLNDETETVLKENPIKNLKYFRVEEKDRGLTKQRNFGIKQVPETSEIICFLDDDIILSTTYFENLISTYSTHKEALAVGGYITNEINWQTSDKKNNPSKFYYDGWMREEPSRFKLRKKLGLQPDATPGFMPTFSHGRAVGFLPPSGKIYEVEQIMGGVSSYRKEVFKNLSFSTYFEGYGLYEDADFSLRISKLGKLYINTNAQLQHYHDGSGRPNKFNYGKMVVRNGWYVWRVKYPNPAFKARLKWHATVLLLIGIRFSNIFNTNKKQEALTESMGRIFGFLSIIFKIPNLKN